MQAKLSSIVHENKGLGNKNTIVNKLLNNKVKFIVIDIILQKPKVIPLDDFFAKYDEYEEIINLID